MHKIDHFIKNWRSSDNMVPIIVQDIAELESKLAAVLPAAYKYLLSTYGLVHSPNVLTKTCHLNSDVSQVQDFLNLEDVYSLTKLYEMAGLPKGYCVFSSDSQGNMFCFNHLDCANDEQDVPVYFFNYALGTIEITNNSFIEWLEAFYKL